MSNIIIGGLVVAMLSAVTTAMQGLVIEDVSVDIEHVGTSATFDELTLTKCADKDGMIAFSAAEAWGGSQVVNFFCITEAK